MAGGTVCDPQTAATALARCHVALVEARRAADAAFGRIIAEVTAHERAVAAGGTPSATSVPRVGGVVGAAAVAVAASRLEASRPLLLRLVLKDAVQRCDGALAACVAALGPQPPPTPGVAIEAARPSQASVPPPLGTTDTRAAPTAATPATVRPQGIRQPLHGHSNNNNTNNNTGGGGTQEAAHNAAPGPDAAAAAAAADDAAAAVAATAPAAIRGWSASNAAVASALRLWPCYAAIRAAAPRLPPAAAAPSLQLATGPGFLVSPLWSPAERLALATALLAAGAWVRIGRLGAGIGTPDSGVVGGGVAPVPPPPGVGGVGDGALGLSPAAAAAVDAACAAAAHAPATHYLCPDAERGAAAALGACGVTVVGAAFCERLVEQRRRLDAAGGRVVAAACAAAGPAMTPPDGAARQQPPGMAAAALVGAAFDLSFVQAGAGGGRFGGHVQGQVSTASIGVGPSFLATTPLPTPAMPSVLSVLSGGLGAGGVELSAMSPSAMTAVLGGATTASLTADGVRPSPVASSSVVGTAPLPPPPRLPASSSASPAPPLSVASLSWRNAPFGANGDGVEAGAVAEPLTADLDPCDVGVVAAVVAGGGSAGSGSGSGRGFAALFDGPAADAASLARLLDRLDAALLELPRRAAPAHAGPLPSAAGSTLHLSEVLSVAPLGGGISDLALSPSSSSVVVLGEGSHRSVAPPAQVGAAARAVAAATPATAAAAGGVLPLGSAVGSNGPAQASPLAGAGTLGAAGAAAGTAVPVTRSVLRKAAVAAAAALRVSPFGPAAVLSPNVDGTSPPLAGNADPSHADSTGSGLAAGSALVGQKRPRGDAGAVTAGGSHANNNTGASPLGGGGSPLAPPLPVPIIVVDSGDVDGSDPWDDGWDAAAKRHGWTQSQVVHYADGGEEREVAGAVPRPRRTAGRRATAAAAAAAAAAVPVVPRRVADATVAAPVVAAEGVGAGVPAAACAMTGATGTTGAGGTAPVAADDSGDERDALTGDGGGAQQRNPREHQQQQQTTLVDPSSCVFQISGSLPRETRAAIDRTEKFLATVAARGTIVTPAFLAACSAVGGVVACVGPFAGLARPSLAGPPFAGWRVLLYASGRIADGIETILRVGGAAAVVRDRAAPPRFAGVDPTALAAHSAAWAAGVDAADLATVTHVVFEPAAPGVDGSGVNALPSHFPLALRLPRLAARAYTLEYIYHVLCVAPFLPEAAGGAVDGVAGEGAVPLLATPPILRVLESHWLGAKIERGRA